MIIRPATPSNLQALAEIINTSCVDKRNFAEVTGQRLEQLLSRGEGLRLSGLFLASENDKVVGACHSLYEPFDRAGYIAYLLAPTQEASHIWPELLKAAENHLHKAVTIAFGSPHTPLYQAVEGRFQPLWGSTEVMGIDSDDLLFLQFLKSNGYEVVQKHVTMVRNLTDLKQVSPIPPLGQAELLKGDDCWYNAYNWYGRTSAEEFGLRNKSLHVLVLRQDNKVMGHVAWYPMRGGTAAAICDLEVARNYRGKGLGKYLLHCALINIREEGFNSVELHTSEGLSPIGYRLYLNEGFTIEKHWLELSRRIRRAQ